jgi:predicted TPR repeat methyltransferase
LRGNQVPAALKCYLQAQLLRPEDNEVNYLISALQQKEPINHDDRVGSLQFTSAPKQYVSHLFDQYAAHFEAHLKLLAYKVPQLLSESIANVLNDLVLNANNNLVEWRILDLGCGTGLAGLALERIFTKISGLKLSLFGIDLSQKMLALAAEKGIYSSLDLISIEQGLENYSNLDCIVAADSLVYCGDLQAIFLAAHHSLKTGGIFAFTLEQSPVYPYILQQSARFAHNEVYFKELAAAWRILAFKSIELRWQNGNPVVGYLIILQKS